MAMTIISHCIPCERRRIAGTVTQHKKREKQINENISKSIKRITRFLSKEDTLVISEIFEGNDCL